MCVDEALEAETDLLEEIRDDFYWGFIVLWYL
jgi:hypothetical protein